MKAALLAGHVLAAIVLVGPVTVSASVFPRYVRAAIGPGAPAAAARASAAAMHRISRGYAVPALAVPVLGVATAAALHVLSEAWVLASMGLTTAAGLVLGLGVVPQQQQVLRALGQESTARSGVERLGRLTGMTGMFNLVWAAVVVLMIVRPGSTTGV